MSTAGRSPDLRDSAAIFAALGDGTRLGLVSRLAGGEAQSITELTSGFNMTRQAVAKHLHVLAEAGLVSSRRLGREQLWELQPARLADARRFLETVGQHWEAALWRLKAKLESEAEHGVKRR